MKSRPWIVAALLAGASAMSADQAYYRVLLLPSGSVVAIDHPVLKGDWYLFHEYPTGALVSLRKSDLGRIAPLTPSEAWQITEQITPIGNLPMEGGAQAGPIHARNVRAPEASPRVGNWWYQGVPGVTDAYAPASAVIVDGVPK